MLQFESDTADAIRGIIAEEQAEDTIGFTDDNNWHLCFEQAEVDAFEDSLKRAGEHAGLRKFVDRVRRVPEGEVDERNEPPHQHQSGLRDTRGDASPACTRSLLYNRAHRIAREKGIELNLVTDLPVLAVHPSPSHTVLTTAKGDISATYVVHATNGYASHLLPHLSSSDGGIIPTRAQVVAVAPTAGKFLWGTALSAGGGYEYGHQRPARESALYILGGGREHATGREWGVADDTAINEEVSRFLHPYLAKTFPSSYGTRGKEGVDGRYGVYEEQRSTGGAGERWATEYVQRGIVAWHDEGVRVCAGGGGYDYG